MRSAATLESLPPTPCERNNATFSLVSNDTKSIFYFFFPFDFPFVTAVDPTLEARDPFVDVPLLVAPFTTALTALFWLCVSYGSF